MTVRYRNSEKNSKKFDKRADIYSFVLRLCMQDGASYLSYFVYIIDTVSTRCKKKLCLTGEQTQIEDTVKNVCPLVKYSGTRRCRLGCFIVCFIISHKCNCIVNTLRWVSLIVLLQSQTRIE